MADRKQPARAPVAKKAGKSADPPAGPPPPRLKTQLAQEPAPVPGNPPGLALREHDLLYHAVEGFIRGNSNFESSLPINAAVEEVGGCTDLDAAFATPLQHKLLSMEAALRWALFLSIAPGRAVEEGDPPFAPEAPFDARGALALIAGVYDVGVQEAVWEHFETDDEDDEDDEGDEGDEGGAGDEAGADSGALP